MARIVVTGLGVVAPNACGVETFETALREGRSGIRRISELVGAGHACHIGGKPSLTPSDLDGFIPDDQRLQSNSFLDYVVRAGLECWIGAGLEPSAPHAPDYETGAIVGSVFGGSMETFANDLLPVVQAGEVRRLGTTIAERAMGSGGSARLAAVLGLGGPTFGSSNACATGADAVLLGATLIRSGVARRMLVGGGEGFSPHINAIWDAMRLSTRVWNHAPDAGSRPLSASVSGLVPSAGAGMLLLEDHDTAIRRGAHVHAEFLGGHMNCGGQRNGGSVFRANYEALATCVSKALETAGVRPAELHLINGHFTSTKADVHEFRCWTAALSLTQPESFPYVSATKSLIGHTIGASGAIETIATILQVSKGFVHGNPNTGDLHSSVLSYHERIPERTVNVEVRTAAKTSLGFGDVNCCLLFRRYEGARDG